MISYTHKNSYLIPISFCFQILLLLMIDNVIASFSWGLLAFILPTDTHVKEKAERTPELRGNTTRCITWGTTHTWKREFVFWSVAPWSVRPFLAFTLEVNLQFGSDFFHWIRYFGISTIRHREWLVSSLSQLSGACIMNVLLFVSPLSFDEQLPCLGD